MPVLPAAAANQAESAAAEGASFEAYPPGVYTARLAKVEVGKAQDSGNTMWKLEFDTVHDLDGNKRPGRLWTNLVIVDTAMWKVGQFFTAYGVPTSTNTDHLINHRCRLMVEQKVIGKGKRQGQMGNEIGGFQPLHADDAGFAELTKLQGRLAKEAGSKPAKAAPAKAAAKPAAEPAEAPEPAAAQPAEADASGNADDSDIDF